MNPVFEAFELAAHYRRLAESLAEQHEDPQVIQDTLEAESGRLDDHLENLAKMVRNIESADSGVLRTMEDLAARHAGLQRAAVRGRKLLLDLMQRAQRDRVTTALFSIAVRKNPPAVVVDCAADLPLAFLQFPEPPAPVPDKKAIAASLKAGLNVPGAHLEQGMRLEIR
ncbi:siphovirus Gp157 family protein [Janthinobacterium sp. 17J80-10]|uniref:siphovirus Gp157 family protein n=1 Tax=Janthinobacterium sp. 17J80-10 TaxID=2497863 RepID=UPI0010056F57|nr:siphovirus Gp157 family protein [Janthinobacterium sp. 17J80-10]QAU34036.1 siphovirus Gp157 family protein [Janthinobacterium sp. 17J80-10]